MKADLLIIDDPFDPYRYRGENYSQEFWSAFTCNPEGVYYQEDISPISYDEWLCLNLPYRFKKKWM